MTTSVTLLYDWKYCVYGKHYKRNYENPIVIKGRSRIAISVDPTKTIDEQNKELKNQMKEDLTMRYRQEAVDEFHHSDDEEFDYETFKFYNIREATRWSDLEDFSCSK